MISIITPVYNAENYLSKCIGSVRDQGYTDWELILIDDGSSDNSYQLMQQYALSDSRIKVFKQNNSGPAAARNKGMREAEGDYITFLDSDDWIVPDALEKIDSIIQRFSPDMVMWAFKRFENGKYKSGKSQLPGNGYYDRTQSLQFLGELIFNYDKKGRQYAPFLWIRAIKSSIIRNNSILFDESLLRSEDLLFCIEIQNLINSMYVMQDSELTIYRCNNTSITHSYIPNYMEMIDVVYNEIMEIVNKREQNVTDLIMRANYMYVYRAIFAIGQESRYGNDAFAAIESIKCIMNKMRLKEAMECIKDNGKNVFGRRFVLLYRKQALLMYILFRHKR